jgi:hypothetical protein
LRSNSTGTPALMHAIYNGIIAIAMIHPAGLQVLGFSVGA